MCCAFGATLAGPAGKGEVHSSILKKERITASDATCVVGSVTLASLREWLTPLIGVQKTTWGEGNGSWFKLGINRLVNIDVCAAVDQQK
jgi:hypothetical protein